MSLTLPQFTGTQTIQFTFFLQAFQLIPQVVVHLRQCSPHSPHAEFRVDTNLHPLSGGWRCCERRQPL